MSEVHPIPRVAEERIEDAVRLAREAMDRAYAPYSGFQVGAAIIAGDRTFTGPNIENASYPVSMCAERNAIAHMVNAGERRIDAVAIVTAADRPTPPCGACRQALWEFGPGSLVVSQTVSGERAMWALEDLLPDAFGPNDLSPR
jgi:cytidine deaminase